MQQYLFFYLFSSIQSDKSSNQYKMVSTLMHLVLLTAAIFPEDSIRAVSPTKRGYIPVLLENFQFFLAKIVYFIEQQS
jgi:hypothetical protein